MVLHQMQEEEVQYPHIVLEAEEVDVRLKSRYQNPVVTYAKQRLEEIEKLVQQKAKEDDIHLYNDDNESIESVKSQEEGKGKGEDEDDNNEIINDGEEEDDDDDIRNHGSSSSSRSERRHNFIVPGVPGYVQKINHVDPGEYDDSSKCRLVVGLDDFNIMADVMYSDNLPETCYINHARHPRRVPHSPNDCYSRVSKYRPRLVFFRTDVSQESVRLAMWQTFLVYGKYLREFAEMELSQMRSDNIWSQLCIFLFACVMQFSIVGILPMLDYFDDTWYQKTVFGICMYISSTTGMKINESMTVMMISVVLPGIMLILYREWRFFCLSMHMQAVLNYAKKIEEGTEQMPSRHITKSSISFFMGPPEVDTVHLFSLEETPLELMELYDFLAYRQHPNGAKLVGSGNDKRELGRKMILFHLVHNKVMPKVIQMTNVDWYKSHCEDFLMHCHAEIERAEEYRVGVNN